MKYVIKNMLTVKLWVLSRKFSEHNMYPSRSDVTSVRYVEEKSNNKIWHLQSVRNLRNCERQVGDMCTGT